jgi:hypothetical protein
MTLLVKGGFHHYKLSEFDKLCFVCPVEGGCDDSSPLCLLTQAEAERELERMYTADFVSSRILRLLQENGSAGASEITAATGTTERTARRVLWRLKNLGLVDSQPAPGQVPAQAPHIYALRVAIPLSPACKPPGTNGDSA